MLSEHRRVLSAYWRRAQKNNNNNLLDVQIGVLHDRFGTAALKQVCNVRPPTATMNLLASQYIGISKHLRKLLDLAHSHEE